MRIYRWAIAKYCCYILLAVLLFHLQNIPGFFAIAGIRPMPVVALAFAVALVEKEAAAGLFGLFCGYLCDLFGYERMGYYMLFLFVLCIAAGLVARNYLRASWLVCSLLTFVAMLFTRATPILFRFVLPELAGGGQVLLAQELPRSLYTAVLSIPLFWLARWLHGRAERAAETRL